MMNGSVYPLAIENGSIYRIKTPTLAIGSPRAGRIPVTVPAGALTKIVALNANTDTFVEVEWEGRIVRMFKVDVQTRGELVAAAK